jgi:hypothetical protein
MKAQNEIRAMNKDLLKHTVGWVLMKSTSGAKDRTLFCPNFKCRSMDCKCESLVGHDPEGLLDEL